MTKDEKLDKLEEKIRDLENDLLAIEYGLNSKQSSPRQIKELGNQVGKLREEYFDLLKSNEMD